MVKMKCWVQVDPLMHLSVKRNVSVSQPYVNSLLCLELHHTLYTMHGQISCSFRSWILIYRPTSRWLFFFYYYYIFRLSYRLTSDDLWPWYMTSDLTNIWRFPHSIDRQSLVPIWLQFFKWGDFLHLQPILQLDLRWPLTAWTYEGSHIISINQVWFQSDFNFFKWDHFRSFSLFYNLTSDDLWPWYVTFDIINKWVASLRLGLSK